MAEKEVSLEQELVHVEKAYPGFLEQFLDFMEQGAIDGNHFDTYEGSSKCFYGHLHDFTGSTEVIRHEADQVAVALTGDPNWSSPITRLLFSAVSPGDTPATNDELWLLKKTILSVLLEKNRMHHHAE